MGQLWPSAAARSPAGGGRAAPEETAAATSSFSSLSPSLGTAVLPLPLLSPRAPLSPPPGFTHRMSMVGGAGPLPLMSPSGGGGGTGGGAGSAWAATRSSVSATATCTLSAAAAAAAAAAARPPAVVSAATATTVKPSEVRAALTEALNSLTQRKRAAGTAGGAGANQSPAGPIAVGTPASEATGEGGATANGPGADFPLTARGRAERQATLRLDLSRSGPRAIGLTTTGSEGAGSGSSAGALGVALMHGLAPDNPASSRMLAIMSRPSPCFAAPTLREPPPQQSAARESEFEEPAQAPVRYPGAARYRHVKSKVFGPSSD